VRPIETASADLRDVLVEAEVGRNVDTKQINVATGSDSVRSKPQYWIGTVHCRVAESSARKQQFNIVYIEFQSVGRHPGADFFETTVKLYSRYRCAVTAKM